MHKCIKHPTWLLLLCKFRLFFLPLKRKKGLNIAQTIHGSECRHLIKGNVSTRVRTTAAEEAPSFFMVIETTAAKDRWRNFDSQAFFSTPPRRR